MSQQKRKQLHYRTAEFLNPSGRSLQDLVEDALQRLAMIKERKQPLNDASQEDEKWYRFINTHRSAMGMEFGALVLLAPGQNKLLIETDEDKDEAELSHITAPDDKEFLESILFYGIKNNHVILLQSISMKARDLEGYLNWLLIETGLIDNENMVFLNNFAPREVYENLEHNDIKSVRVGSDLTSPISRHDYQANLSETKNIRFRRQNIGLDILNFLIPNRIKEISDDLGDTSNIEVFVEVTYKRQTDEDSQKAINKISSALRHVSEDDLRIEFKDGVTITGSDIKIKSFRSITSYNNNLDVTDVFSNMRTWLEELLSNNIINP